MKKIMFIALISILGFQAQATESTTSTDAGKINISADPLGIITGRYFVSASYALSPILAIKGDIGYINDIEDNDNNVKDGVSGFGLGISAPLYFKEMYSGIFLEPGLLYANIQDKESGEKTNAFGPSMSIGYHWMFDSNLNIALSVGAQRNFHTNKDNQVDNFDEYDEIRAIGYLRVGYKF